MSGAGRRAWTHVARAYTKYILQQIAKLCKLLPLTLGIAGRLIRDLGLVSRVDKLTSRRGTHSAKPDDWTEAVSLLEQELDDHTRRYDALMMRRAHHLLATAPQ